MEKYKQFRIKLEEAVITIEIGHEYDTRYEFDGGDVILISRFKVLGVSWSTDNESFKKTLAEKFSSFSFSQLKLIGCFDYEDFTCSSDINIPKYKDQRRDSEYLEYRDDLEKKIKSMF